MSVPNEVRCVGCGGLFPDIDGPVHRYMLSSPGCWTTYSAVVSRESSDPEQLPLLQLCADAYAVQHPGKPSPESINSVGFHLLRLCLSLEYSLTETRANTAILAFPKKAFVWLEPPVSFSSITVADVSLATIDSSRRRVVKEWAWSAWDTWSEHHKTVDRWASWLPL